MLFRIQPLCEALESNITKGTSTILLTKHCIIISVIDYHRWMCLFLSTCKQWSVYKSRRLQNDNGQVRAELPSLILSAYRQKDRWARTCYYWDPGDFQRRQLPFSLTGDMGLVCIIYLQASYIALHTLGRHNIRIFFQVLCLYPFFLPNHSFPIEGWTRSLSLWFSVLMLAADAWNPVIRCPWIRHPANWWLIRLRSREFGGQVFQHAFLQSCQLVPWITQKRTRVVIHVMRRKPD